MERRRDDAMPTGLPDADAPEDDPLGNPDAAQDEAEAPHGEDAMPGIPSEGEPPTGG